MIQIEDLRIVEFRGIRELTISPQGQSYSISGPNGSGKSGVVDAIDFALTGDVSRLKGPGSRGVNLARHGPHVSRRDDPASALVEVTVRDTATGATAKLRRSVKTPDTFTLEPNDESIRAALLRVGQHPELVLSRREIIKFIVTEPGKRASEIQSLLRLDRLTELRATFRSTKSKTSAALKACRSGEESARQALKRHLDISELYASSILTKVNLHRSTLGLDPIDELDEGTKFTAGLTVTASHTTINKVSAKRDAESMAQALALGTVRSFNLLQQKVQALEDDPHLLDSVEKGNLVQLGLAMVVNESCPLCDKPWESLSALKQHLDSKNERLRAAAEAQTDIVNTGSDVAAELRSVEKLVARVAQVATTLRSDATAATLDEWSRRILENAAALSNLDQIRQTVQKLALDPLQVPNSVNELMDHLASSIEDLPDPSATDAARSYLTIAQERWDNLSAMRSKTAKAEAADAAADAIYVSFCGALDEGLAQLYTTVQNRMAEFYRFINSDDESDFKASLDPGAQKLDLLVDFHGQGMFPPVAYHSEGHQDGMGVCLYLALMEQQLGDEFRFAVLDDVVMSVDINHRRQFCALLKTFFPTVQFVITTHDEVWARQMQQSGLISKASQSRFLKWSVADGPTVLEGYDFWDKIYQDLNNNDVNVAAARLRRNLEARLADICEQLGGMVPYRSSGNWDLGEYLNAVRGRYNKILGQAAKAANAWNNAEAVTKVREAKAIWASASMEQMSEAWAVNPAVHYNEWENFTKADFEPVVRACKDFLAVFQCSTCDMSVAISKVNGRDESIRCACGAFNLNLLGR